ncbi:MAG: DUF4249 family protein [Chitinophagales bacterium]
MKFLTYSSYISSIFFCIFFFSACEEVIILDLEKAERRVIIEAKLDASAMTATVLLTKSNNFYETTTPQTVSDANITLVSENGQSYTFTESEEGVYVANDVFAAPDEVFTISIESENEVYQATATTPYPVALDSLVSDIITAPFSGEEIISVSAYWTDLPEVLNFYRVRTFTNDTLLTGDYNLTNDDFTTDNAMTSFIRNAFEEGDEARIQLLSTNRVYYDYFYQISVAGDSDSTTPFNPKGNFDNDALGYFGIYFVSEEIINL